MTPAVKKGFPAGNLLTAVPRIAIIKAVNEGADYVTLGPICTKQNEFVDESAVNWIYDNVKIPVFFTGDITPDNITEITQSGISKIALTESVMYSKIPEQSARNFLKYLP